MNSDVTLADQVADAVRSGVSDADVDVQVDGNRALITVESAAFDGLTRVKQQQLVYATIKDFISDGRLHAVSIRALAR